MLTYVGVNVETAKQEYEKALAKFSKATAFEDYLDRSGFNGLDKEGELYVHDVRMYDLAMKIDYCTWGDIAQIMKVLPPAELIMNTKSDIGYRVKPNDIENHRHDYIDVEPMVLNVKTSRGLSTYSSTLEFWHEWDGNIVSIECRMHVEEWIRYPSHYKTVSDKRHYVKTESLPFLGLYFERQQAWWTSGNDISATFHNLDGDLRDRFDDDTPYWEIVEWLSENS